MICGQVMKVAKRQFARAIKNLTLAEEHLHDHFPGYPVMPASLIIEGLAQTGGILVGEAGGFAEKVVLAKIPRAEFFGERYAQVVCPGPDRAYEPLLDLGYVELLGDALRAVDDVVDSHEYRLR